MSHGFRVLHLTDYASSYEGAFIRQLRMLDDDLRARGARPSALAITQAARDRPWADALVADGWELHVVPPTSTRGSTEAVAGIARAVQAAMPDVLHVHFGTYDLAARRAVRRMGGVTPDGRELLLVWHYRTALEEAVDERGLVRRAKDWIKFTRASRDVDLVVGVTKALAEEATARGVAPGKARGIVAGCDTETFRPDAAARARVRDELGVAPDELLLLHMGWHWHRKGGDLLAAAVEQLTTSRPDARIVACSIGAPDDPAELGPVRALPMTDRVHELHQAADIFVSASRSEGFGNGLVEAMACERVAVAAAADGQLETFAGIDGVIPTTVEDAADLARGIETLLDRRETWAALGARNREHVVRNHSMRRWAREMADAYGELVDDRLAAAPAPSQEVA